MNIFFVLIFLLFVFLFYGLGSFKKSPREEEITPLFTERCGGSFGFTNLMPPLVRHAIYDQFVIISYGNTMLELNFNEINLVSKPRYLIGDFIRYHHNVSTLPRKIIINTRNSNEIIELLNKSNIKNKSTNA